MAQRVSFHMATVKGAFVSSKICSSQRLTNCCRGKKKKKRKERLKRKYVVFLKRRGIFWWAKDVFWWKRDFIFGSIWFNVTPKGLGRTSGSCFQKLSLPDRSLIRSAIIFNSICYLMGRSSISRQASPPPNSREEEIPGGIGVRPEKDNPWQ